MLSRKKYLVEKILEPLIKPLVKANPNVLTLLGSIPSILFFVCVINKLYIFAIISFIGTVFDALDGMVARKYNKVTKFGGFLDSVFDRISDFLIISAFAFGGLVRWDIAAPVILVSFLISYIRSRGELANLNVSFNLGIMKRTERLVLIIISLIVYLVFPNTIFSDFNIIEMGFVVLLILSFYTVLQRINHAYKKL